jgi:hypothetical protein
LQALLSKSSIETDAFVRNFSSAMVERASITYGDTHPEDIAKMVKSALKLYDRIDESLRDERIIMLKKVMENADMLY